MVVQTKNYAASTLRALTYRIAATPTTQLPRNVSTLASSIWACQEILSTSLDSLKNDGELSVIVHRFKTQLATLLQDRTVEGRWSAVVLVKTAIEAGGAELLSKSNGWVRSLLAILKRPDPATTRVLAVLTLTRIFMLTWDYSNLVREIATPALPAYVSTCLSNADNARCTAEELQNILESFKVLVPHHPTIFRTNEAALSAFLLKIVSSSAQTDAAYYTAEHIATAQELFALLPLCVPKQGGAVKWEEDLHNTIKAAHETGDILFTPVIETWKSNIDAFREHGSTRQVLAPIEQSTVDSFKLHAWKGTYAGAERLMVLIDQITAHVSSTSPNVVHVRIGMIIDLTSRLAAITVPGSNKQTTIQANPQIAKEEREALFAVLPRVHASVLHLLDILLRRLNAAVVAAVPAILEMLVAIFAAESQDTRLRISAYNLLKSILTSIGPSFNKDEVVDLTAIITSCSEDCESHLQSKNIDAAAAKKQTDLVLSLVKTEASNPVCEDNLHYAASSLLPLLLLQIEAGKIPRRLRTQLDRTAILTKNKHALLASVLSPAPSSSGHGLQSSLLPFLARLYPDDPEVEALIRPRMPYVDGGSKGDATEEDELDVEDAEEGEEAEVVNDDVDMEEAASDGESDDNDNDIPLPANKHTLEHDAVDGDAKRPRLATASSQIQSEWQAALETSAAAEASSATPEVEQMNIIAVNQAEAITLAGDEDDSDFEMPPLTMDSDSEDEEEDE